MSQLCPASLDWYRASYVHERLAMRRTTPSLLTPRHIDAARGKRHLERWRAEAPFSADEWWSQRVALERASEEEWYTILGESSHAMSQTVCDVPAWVTLLLPVFACPPAAPAPLSLPGTWSKHQAVRFLEAFGSAHPADTESFVHTTPRRAARAPGRSKRSSDAGSTPL